MAVLLTGGKLHHIHIYRQSAFIYLFISLSSERIYHAAKLEKWRYDLSFHTLSFSDKDYLVPPSSTILLLNANDVIFYNL